MSRATGRIYQRASCGRRALPPPQRNQPTRNPSPIKALPATIPRAPKEGRSQKVTKSHSLGRRQDSPPVCANRARSGEGNTRELWVRPKYHHLHPPQRTSCARQNSQGSRFLPLHEYAIPRLNFQKVHPHSRSNHTRFWPKVHPRPQEVHLPRRH